ncbi:uncharacterized protein [Littorina saxatilis]|uniref:uncharacterized protein n=1 Tax=Littorina saxatilis TaxID=31220 RepID=UPI0038B5E2AA
MLSLAVSLLTYVLTLSRSSGSAAPDQLHVLWMAPVTPVLDGRRPMFSASTSVGALSIAIERVESERLLGDKQINLTSVDSACDAKISLGVLVTYLQHTTPDVILGPPCTVGLRGCVILG